MKERILITSALPYVNNVPHMGNIIGCVLSADVYARFRRSIGDEVLYVCGTDEHGTATETKAQEEGLSPRQICDKYYAIHRDIYAWFGISFDIFGRTSAPNHHAITQEIFRTLHANGHIIERTLEQTYCETCKKFLADRYVEGTCPHCNFADARGDQCDACGKLLNPEDLIDAKCKTCKSTPGRKPTKHLFLDLAGMQERLTEWVRVRSEEGAWAQNAIRTTEAWLEKGLEPRAITRDLSWGVPVPLAGYESKVFYVWFDAPIGYVSITGQLESVDWRAWWQSPDVKLYQFMAKDNIPFHTILFPATLLATGDPWTMLYHISSTEYLQHEDGKFSKSRGTGLFGDDAMRLGIPADVYRYYLLINRPESSDTTFAWKDLQEKLNNELLANLGNLVNRTLTFIKNYQEGMVHEAVLDELSANFREWVSEESAMVTKELRDVRIKDALKRVMLISQKANAYFQEQTPWKTRTEDPEACRRAMFVLANTIKDLAIMLEPYVPTTSARIFDQLALEPRTWKDLGNMSIANHAIGTPATLFEKIDDKRLDAIKQSLKKPDVIAQPKGLRIQAGRIIEASRHPQADKLFVETVDFGESGMRTIVSGLVGHYREEDLRGKTFLFVTNLKSALLRGVESQGMILAAQGDVVEAIETTAAPGTICDGLDADEEISIDVFGAHQLTAEGGAVLVDGKPLAIGGVPVKTARVKDGKVR